MRELRTAYHAFRHTLNAIASIAGAFTLGCVPGLDLFRPMPVVAVNLDKQVGRRRVQVEYIPPDFVFSDDFNVLCFKCGPDRTLREGFTDKAAVTHKRTKTASTVRLVGRNNAELLVACLAFLNHWRATTFLRAMPSNTVSRIAELFATSFTGCPFGQSALAFHRAYIVPVSGRGSNTKLLAAYRASFSHSPIPYAFQRAIPLLGLAGVKLFTALWADTRRMIDTLTGVLLPSLDNGAPLAQRPLLRLAASCGIAQVSLFAAPSAPNYSESPLLLFALCQLPTAFLVSLGVFVRHIYLQIKSAPLCAARLPRLMQTNGTDREIVYAQAHTTSIVVRPHESRQRHYSTDERGCQRFGSVCLGRSRCRCIRTLEYNPAEYRRLTVRAV